MIMFSGSFGIDLGWEDSYNDYDSEKMKKLKEMLATYPKKGL